MLRAQLGLLLGAIMLLYIFVDSFNGVKDFIPWYTGGIVASVLIVVLNRLGKYILSSTILIVVSNLLVFLFAMVDNPGGGVYFFFMATAATGLVLLNHINTRIAYLFALVSIVLAAIAYFGNFKSPILPPNQSDLLIKTSFAINFIVGISSCLLIIHFVTRRNQEFEDSLIANQEILEVLTVELEKSKNRFSMAVEGSKAGIYEWEITTNKVYVSSRWLELLGYGEDDDVDVNLEFFMSMVHPEDAEKTGTSIQKAMETGAIFENELRMKRKDGTYRWFYDTGLIRKENGSPTLAVGSISDVHDKKIADQKLIEQNQELEKTNEELDRFVYSASHDMRAPLSTLLGLLDLAKSIDDPEEVNKYLDMMMNRIHTMEGFIKEVTDYSRNTRLEVSNEVLLIKPIIEEVMESFSFLANEENVKFELDVDPELKIRSDSARIRVVLNNLIANAIKYHNPFESNRFVKIKAFKEGMNFVINITDNGLGIKDEYMERIFEMFFRGTEKSSGSGLGLYIVKETIEKLNGSVKCTSKPSNGTTFEVLLPHINDRGPMEEKIENFDKDDVSVQENQHGM
jgi:PAS domain S-box-containing protein